MKVLKFGGTSVGSAERMKQVGKLITTDNEAKIVVLSAVSGTTNALVAIGEQYAKEDKNAAKKLIEELEAKYYIITKELYSTPEFLEAGNEVVKEHFNFMKSFAVQVFNVFQERALLAQGELISTKLFNLYMQESGFDSILLPALDYMRIDKDEEPDMEFIRTYIAKELAKYPGKTLFVTQGYICRNTFGEIDNLKRGGSDYSASIIGNAVKSSVIEIWTDIDGMHNNDPRVVDKTRPVARLSFDEAAELAYFGAKILHPQSIRPAKDANIPVKLLNTMQPEAKGTTITAEPDNSGAAVKAIAAKDGIVAVKIKSDRMLLAYGFLRSVFEVFERFKTPIDMITTSEVAVSVTIDKVSHLKEIVSELEAFGTVSVDEKQTIVCVVGNLIEDKEGMAEKIFSSLRSVPVRMISYGGSNNNVSILVSEKDKVAALKALNDGLFDFSNEKVLS